MNCAFISAPEFERFGRIAAATGVLLLWFVPFVSLLFSCGAPIFYILEAPHLPVWIIWAGGAPADLPGSCSCFYALHATNGCRDPVRVSSLGRDELVYLSDDDRLELSLLAD
jgi:hypothetical protein